MIASSIVVGFATNASTLADAELLPWKNVVAVMLVAPMGMVFAWGAVAALEHCRRRRRGAGGAERASAAAVPSPVKATVVIETGVQNTVLALAIVSLSFADAVPYREFFRMQLVIIFWGLMVTCEASVVMLLFRRIIGREERAAAKTNGDDDATHDDAATTTTSSRGFEK